MWTVTGLDKEEGIWRSVWWGWGWGEGGWSLVRSGLSWRICLGAGGQTIPGQTERSHIPSEEKENSLKPTRFQ